MGSRDKLTPAPRSLLGSVQYRNAAFFGWHVGPTACSAPLPSSV